MNHSGNEPTRIVILGAGFGGVYALKEVYKRYKNKKNVLITIINTRNYFLFTPLLHEVATGSLWPENIIEPLRELFPASNVRVLTAEVQTVSLSRKVVKTSRCEFAYDYLVCALGAQTNFYNIPGVSDHAFTLKTLEDAIDLKNHFIELFEEASITKDEGKQRELLSFYIVGGGPTGVELAAEMSEFFYDTFGKLYDPRLIKNIRITLVQKADALLNHFPPSLQKKSAEVLRKKKVDVRFGVDVLRVGNTEIETSEGVFPTRTVIWAAGVKPATLSFDTDVQKDTMGRFLVDENLRLVSNPFVYAIGDSASFAQKNEHELPMLAQVAVKEGVYVGRHIASSISHTKIKPFYYKHMGDLVSLGEWAAIGEIKGIRLWGHLTWALWRGVYLFKLVSWRKRFQVLLDWTIDIFTPRDISELYKK